MRRTLSTEQTVLYKIVLPIFWALLVIVSNEMDFARGPDRVFFLFAWVVGSAFIYWGGIRLKIVSVDNEFLYVSNYLKEIAIPLSNIKDVTQNVFNSQNVTIHLTAPCEFGKKIVFLPPPRFFSFFSQHPVVDELLRLARANDRQTKQMIG